MATWAQLRDRVRRALEDTDASGYLWSDTELADDLGEGYREVGKRWPYESVAAIAGVNGQSSYALGAQVRSVVSVSVSGYAVPQRADGSVVEVGQAQTWAVVAGSLVFAQALSGGEAISVVQRGLYTVPTADGTASGLGEEYEDVVVWTAVVAALQRRSVQASKRQGGASSMSLTVGQAMALQREALRRCRSARSGTLYAV